MQLLRWDYDSTTASYFLLLARKQAGKQYQLLLGQQGGAEGGQVPELLLPDLLPAPAAKQRPALADATSQLANSPRGLHTSLEGGLDNIALLNIGTPPAPAPAPASDQEQDKAESGPAVFERTGNKNRARFENSCVFSMLIPLLADVSLYCGVQRAVSHPPQEGGQGGAAAADQAGHRGQGKLSHTGAYTLVCSLLRSSLCCAAGRDPAAVRQEGWRQWGGARPVAQQVSRSGLF